MDATAVQCDEPIDGASPFPQKETSGTLLIEANAARIARRWDSAIGLYRQYLRKDPNSVSAWNNLGLPHQAVEELDEALRCFRRAASLRPDAAGIFANIGNVLKEKNELGEELSAYEYAVRLNPDDPDLHISLSVALLTAGDYRRGWREYEWRLRGSGATRGLGIRTFPRPLWDGSPLNGRRLLVYAEQGLGDSVQFLRYLPLLARFGGRVMFACQQEVMPLEIALKPPIDSLVPTCTIRDSAALL